MRLLELAQISRLHLSNAEHAHFYLVSGLQAEAVDKLSAFNLTPTENHQVILVGVKVGVNIEFIAFKNTKTQ